MIAGHFGFAAAVKAKEQQTPLWALMLATVWLDIVFVPLFVAKIETISVAPGTSGGYGSAIIHADYTHALLGAIVLSVLFGAAALIRWSRRTAIVLAAVVFSHWLLDLVMHRADMPLLPGNAGNLPEFGFGLWRHPVASLAVELVFVVAGALLYWQAARARVAASGVPKSGRANVAGLLVLTCGIVVLALDFTRIVD
jgi:membrane-bound metal-dependent hydrolase YbcI (DUF457 family)